jgi:STE24 endopeptidase
VLAHKLGHQVHKNLIVGIGIEIVITLLARRSLAPACLADIATLPVFALVMGLCGLVTMPLTNGYSRWRERGADEYALEPTHNAPAFASAMVRLANQNLSEVDPESRAEFWHLRRAPSAGEADPDGGGVAG